MSAPTPIVRLDRVVRVFPDGREVLTSVSLAVGAGEFVSLVGPSGCGKSTLLRLVAGLDRATSGDVESPATRRESGRHTAFVFQDPTLMPWATVLENVALPLRLAGEARAVREAAVRQMLHRVGLDEFADAYPAALSGGMRMRASIARALVTHPRVLLMDEPFAALDQITRQRLNQDLLAWCRARDLAVIFVTHSVSEALFLSDRVLVMSARPGRIVGEFSVCAGADGSPPERDVAWRTSAEFTALAARVSMTMEAA